MFKPMPFLTPLLAAHQVKGSFHTVSRSDCNSSAVGVTGILPSQVFQLHGDPPIFASEVCIFIFASLYQQMHDLISWCSNLTSPIYTDFLCSQEKARTPFTTLSSVSCLHLKPCGPVGERLCAWLWHTPKTQQESPTTNFAIPGVCSCLPLSSVPDCSASK